MARPRGRQGESKRRVLEALRDNGAMSQRELMAVIGATSAGTIVRLLRQLREEQLIRHGFSLSAAGAQLMEEV